MNYQLHKLKEGFVITYSKPEEGINLEATYYDDKVDSNGLVTLPEMFTERMNTYLVKGIKENKRYVYKVIAKQDQIDFSALKEDEKKEIGLLFSDRFTLEEISKHFVGESNEGGLFDDFLDYRIQTNEKITFKEWYLKYQNFTKKWEVELEMEDYEYGRVRIFNYRLKLIDNKVKILKLL